LVPRIGAEEAHYDAFLRTVQKRDEGFA